MKRSPTPDYVIDRTSPIIARRQVDYLFLGFVVGLLVGAFVTGGFS